MEPEAGDGLEAPFLGEDVALGDAVQPVILVGPPRESGPFVASDVELIAARLQARGYRICLYYGSWAMSGYHWFPVAVS